MIVIAILKNHLHTYVQYIITSRTTLVNGTIDFFILLYIYNTPLLQKLMHTRTKNSTNIVADSCNLKILQKQSHTLRILITLHVIINFDSLYS